MTIKLRVFELKKELELKQHRNISNREIARAVDVAPNTVGDMMQGKTIRVNMPTLTAILAWFREQGLDIQPGDLFGED